MEGVNTSQNCTHMNMHIYIYIVYMYIHTNEAYEA